MIELLLILVLALWLLARSRAPHGTALAADGAPRSARDDAAPTRLWWARPAGRPG